MDDQFGGRTDDDLFFDELEPVDSAPVAVADEAAPAPHEAAPAPAEAPAAARPPVAAPRSAAASAGESTGSGESATAHAPSAAPPSAAPPSAVPPSLASSRWAKPVTSTTPPNAAASSSSQRDASSGPPRAPPSHHHKPPPRNTAANADARLQSGANPRQRLTDDELAAKMAQMKLLAAEKTRKFERAEMDQRQHAEAYARGMEEARRRRADDAERRRRADEDRRRLDDERARNRERKLRAMSAKEGGWDEGKDPADSDGPPRSAFRGANGGVRGARGGDVPDVDRFLDDRHRTPRGRGRGGGRARAAAYQDGGPPPPSKKPGDAAPALTAAEFPALPGAGIKPAPAVVPPLPSPPPSGGTWDDEMEALDAISKGQS